MPDTGAPWNIPYVDATDLVSAWPAASLDIADQIATNLTTLDNAIDAVPIPAGIGSNVVQTVKTDTYSTSSGTFGDITGFSVTITPSSASSKVLVLANYTLGNTTNGAGAHTQLLRNSTVLYRGDADGSRVRTSASYQSSDSVDSQNATIVFLDSPNTTSSTTYKVQLRRGTTGTAWFGRSGENTDNADRFRAPASITVIEVAG